MGTNYYLQSQPACPSCGREYERLHIGKSSAGWVFALHVYPENGIKHIGDWIGLLTTPGAKITDEYARVIAPDEMLRTIAYRGRDGKRSEPAWYAVNQAEPGPNGLARSKIDGVHCVGHGEGTWSYHAGDFS